ncbi:hypothetical protein [Actinoplanes palleronii]|uniref:hypothetical protein n=1 Tax=Actinoplanes palleronii TaxID=113570 RepID=UPI0019412A4B|nr:hypothetical protein [Actinoplanes palleronii]
MDERLPKVVRRGSMLLGVCAVAAALMAAVAIDCWWRVGVVADAYHGFAWPASALTYLDRDAGHLRTALAVNAIVLTVTAVVTTLLARGVHRVRPWARPATLWFAAAAGVALVVALVLTPAEVAQPYSDSPIPDMLGVGLAQAGLGEHVLSQGYPTIATVLTLIALGALIAAAVQVSRVSQLDFFRPPDPGLTR